MEIGRIPGAHYNVVSSVTGYKGTKRETKDQEPFNANLYINNHTSDIIVQISQRAKDTMEKPLEDRPKPYIPKGKSFEDIFDKKMEGIK